MAEEVRRDIIHHMGRRCRDWDYGGRAIYMITINLKERGRPVMAEWARSRDDSAEAQEQNLPVSGQAQNWPGNGLRSASAETPRLCASAETPRLCASAETPRLCASAETPRLCASEPERARPPGDGGMATRFGGNAEGIYATHALGREGAIMLAAHPRILADG